MKTKPAFILAASLALVAEEGEVGAKKPEDSAIPRRPNGPACAIQWFYVIDGRPECRALAATEYLKSAGFSTIEAGQYLCELRGPEQPVQMDASEERSFEQ